MSTSEPSEGGAYYHLNERVRVGTLVVGREEGACESSSPPPASNTKYKTQFTRIK